MGGLVAADWAAAALLTTPPLMPPLKSLWLSERLPATVAAAPAAPTKQAKIRSECFHTRALVSTARAAALLGSNTMEACSSCLVRVASYLIHSVIRIASAASSAASAIVFVAQSRGRKPSASVRFQLMFACHSR